MTSRCRRRSADEVFSNKIQLHCELADFAVQRRDACFILGNNAGLGPIAPITSFSSFDEVIERANSLPYGLASFIFTRSSSLATKTEAALNAGMVGVNHMMISTPETPFGGVNESGYGSESGTEGLDAFLRLKFVSEAQVP